MSNELLKYAFVAGELSPSLLGRTDLTKYDLAMAEAYNMFVDYRGGLSSRPGTEFVDFLPDYQEVASSLGRKSNVIESPILYAMKIEAETEYNYIVVIAPVNSTEGGTTFGHSAVRFIQNGEYDLEPAFQVTSVTDADPAVFTVTDHDFEEGDWVRFNNQFVMTFTSLLDTTMVVRDVSGDTFELDILATGERVGAAQIPASPQARISRVYTIETDYRPEHYGTLQFTAVGSDGQDREVNIVRITHVEYPIRNLIWRYYPDDHLDQFGRGWTIEDEVLGINERGPAITSFTASAQPDDGPPLATVLFAVTSVYDNDQESIRGPVYQITDVPNYTVTAGAVTINWTADPDASYYRVYRSVVASDQVLSQGLELGFLGQTKGTSFTDPNIIPDFSRTPSKHHDPFVYGRVSRVVINDGGTGYTDFTTFLTITGGPETDFYAEGIVQSGTGEIIYVDILNAGHDYGHVDHVLDIDGTGTGADIDLVSLTGNYPGVSAIYQQRQIYAGSYNQPVTVWGSQVGLFSNFNTTTNVVDSDAFEFSLNLETFNYAPIRHLVATQIGLLAMTQESIWLINGGGPTQPLTAQNTVASPQDYAGASQLVPLKIGSEVLYAEGKGYAVRSLSYSEASRGFSADDRSILSNHLINAGREIVSWAYQEQPSKIVWCVRADGALLAFTTVKSEDIYAWCSGGTKGQFLAAAAMRENVLPTALLPYNYKFVDSTYFVTQRYIGGRWRRCVERLAQRDFSNLEDAWCLDCALITQKNTFNNTLEGYKLANGNWAFTSPYGLNGEAEEGWVLRGAGGVFKFVEDVYDPGYLYSEYEEIEPPKFFMPETDETEIVPQTRDEWGIVEPFTTVTNLWHLEGETVSILADGKVLEDQVVTDGAITLDTPATLCLIGLPFVVRARSLPITVQGNAVEGKRKRVVGLGVRLENTKGLQAGRTKDELYDVERGGEATVMVNGIHHQLLSTSWEDDSSITFVQNKPLPVTMLSLITDVEVGDDTD